MSERQSAAKGSPYEAAGETDPRCLPVRLGTPRLVGEAIPYPVYSNTDHETWRLLLNRQCRQLEGRSCDEFLRGLEVMGFTPDRIPSLAEASNALKRTTGWRVARAPGLLHEQDFFACLAERIFPSTDYIRPRHEMEYTPAPDLFHDIFGHMPMITNPEFADFYQRLGRAALRARGEDRRRLERFYWFTVEFGLIRTRMGVRVFGNGILSSIKELAHSLGSTVQHRAFDMDAVVEQEYDVWDLQPLLFVIESFEELSSEFDRWASARGL